jgi:tetratricopeptide (TPR) repeat protein
MSGAGWSVARLEGLDSLQGPGTLRWTPVRRHFGVTAFGVNAYTATEAGQDVVEEHTERALGHEELYVVVAGRATFRLGDEELDAPAGTAVFIGDPAVRRGAVAAQPETTVLAIGGKPGRHEISRWEYSFAAYAYAGEGDHERGIAELHAGIAELGEDARLLYDLACVESLGGRTDEALEHLGRALELDAELRRFAAEDADFDAIRTDPRFPS